MRKLILTGSALLSFAALSYAQTIQQVGQQQFAQHNQFGQNQTGTIQQVQSAVDPTLTNYGNYAITFQGTPNNTGANTLLIQQNNGSQGNRAGIGQSGGPGLNATILQNGGTLGLSGGATSSSATIGAPGEDGNFAGISQIGANSTALISESNNSRRNKAETYQNGNNNVANTNQDNNSVSNTAFVFQGFTAQNVIGTAVNNAQATIRQGKVNASDVPAAGSSVTPEAVGSTAVITQTASNVIASIAQGSTGIIASVSPGRADMADARITQSATLTTARIDQGASGGEAISTKASIIQAATNQAAFIVQGYGPLGSDQGSTATIVQNGGSGVAGSNAYVRQGSSGATDGSQAAITQTGTVSNANAQIFQAVATFGTGGSYSSGDKAAITQSGQGVVASINQNGNGQGGNNESNGRDNNATINQGAGVVGNAAVTASPGSIGFTINNTATGVAVINQGITGANADILQTNRNTAAINQVTGTGFRAKVQQGGTGATFSDAAGNTFTLSGLNGTPVTLVGTVANDNTGTITQTSGDNHNANIFQNGRFNTASVAQANGNAHQALIVQTANSQRASATISQTSTGTGNAATILQFAGSNADGVGQYGNMASISQVAGSNNVAFVQQGIQGSATSSNDNVASITQNGSNNFARFLQVGNNNSVAITQNGNNNQVLNLAGDPGSYGSQNGYNNRLTLVQEGGNTGVTFRYTQIGNNNTQVVNQHF